LSINRIGLSSYLTPFPGLAPFSPTGKETFSNIMSGLAAGNPSPSEIKTMASYLQMRLNDALMRAMGGGHYVSPLTLFTRTSFTERPTPSVSDPKASPAAAIPEMVNKAAVAYNMDPSLIAAVIKAESGGNPRATSPKGAMGMMQLMPATAKDLGVTDPYDPLQNVMAGTRYLKTLLSRYDGDRDLALAAYNWGPGNLEKSHRSMPRETVEYVARIKKYLGEKA
jgi:soluble lytic murein transglycosylase-like protein